MLAQKVKFYSIEIDANYYYYFEGDVVSNDYNYGFSGLLTYNLERTKWTTGINFSTKKYYYYTDPIVVENITKREYKLSYLNIPIFFSYKVNKSKTFDITPLIGVIFNNVLTYNITLQNVDGVKWKESGNTSQKKLGVSSRVGLNLSKLFGEEWKLNFGFFSDFKIVPDYKNQGYPDYKDMPEGRVSFGIKIGVEYWFLINGLKK
jgi:hypothetical protein